MPFLPQDAERFDGLSLLYTIMGPHGINRAVQRLEFCDCKKGLVKVIGGYRELTGEEFGIYIKRVIAGGLAALDRLKSGDLILDVNNISLIGVTNDFQGGGDPEDGVALQSHVAAGRQRRRVQGVRADGEVRLQQRQRFRTDLTDAALHKADGHGFVLLVLPLREPPAAEPKRGRHRLQPGLHLRQRHSADLRCQGNRPGACHQGRSQPCRRTNGVHSGNSAWRRLPEGRQAAGRRPAGLHQQGVSDRSDVRGGQKHPDQNQTPRPHGGDRLHQEEVFLQLQQRTTQSHLPAGLRGRRRTPGQSSRPGHHRHRTSTAHRGHQDHLQQEPSQRDPAHSQPVPVGLGGPGGDGEAEEGAHRGSEGDQEAAGAAGGVSASSPSDGGGAEQSQTAGGEGGSRGEPGPPDSDPGGRGGPETGPGDGDGLRGGDPPAGGRDRRAQDPEASLRLGGGLHRRRSQILH
uniref:Syntaxin-binding protein 4-like n=1 Tax=Stegastes partitus TaxID=144197 RepID=A0A3B4ZW59_9TELE